MIKLKEILNEVSVAGDAGTFQGGAGDYIDQKFAGPFHPKFGNIKKELEAQVDTDIAKRMWTDDNTPEAQEDFVDMKYEYGFDKPTIDYDDFNFINNSNTNWKTIDTNLKYDDYNSDYNENYLINQSKTDWEYINKDYHTKMRDGDMRVTNVNIKVDKELEEEFIEEIDRDSTVYAGDNFINKSTTNWEYINK
tara:strand:- start:279 stop:857 length:579 start_codon:yes stop_codon:yes gene_type:complete